MIARATPQQALYGAEAATAAVREIHRKRERRFRNLRTLPALVICAGLFDLACTLSAYQKGWLVEANPLASSVLGTYGAAGLAAYRFALTALGCILLSWGLRAHRARRFSDAQDEHARIGVVVAVAQTAVVATHFALAAWWIAWLTV